ncbi:uncharacterized protein EI90DRAFT_3070978 [Cantharellus anzutake]|uniref:uncharacterized protein n=1 Tax=Cantharellus anzutake TaxID=1750568 RepID=UPI0019070889|nr:uncharacterized protein EI90DRAFT_3070978 [Cantharellus anzutake]KAF8326208.1 hypothetical protein EI90DRAFT_3070978 [Cantharellus anzutake]
MHLIELPLLHVLYVWGSTNGYVLELLKSVGVDVREYDVLARRTEPRGLLTLFIFFFICRSYLQVSGPFKYSSIKRVIYICPDPSPADACY